MMASSFFIEAIRNLPILWMPGILSILLESMPLYLPPVLCHRICKSHPLNALVKPIKIEQLASYRPIVPTEIGLVLA
jgi:hypothetical protein